MKTFNKLSSSLFLLVFFGLQMSAQIVCNNETFLSLDATGNADLYPENIIEGNSGVSPFQIKRGDGEFMDFVSFDCSDADQTIQVTVMDDNGDQCWGNVLVQYFANSLSCNDNVYVSLDNTGSATLTPDMILEGNINCGTYQLKRGDGDFMDAVTFDCSDVGEEIQITVMDETGNQCWGNVMIEDKLKPIPYCVALSTAVVEDDNSVELYAIDFSIGSWDNCSDSEAALDELYFTYGTFAFDFDEVVIDEVTINKSVEFYFNEKGPIAAVSNAPQWVVNDFNNGHIQKWHPEFNSSSKNYLNNTDEATAVELSMSVTDASGNSDYCLVSLTLTQGTPPVAGDCIENINVNTRPWDCTVMDLSASSFVPGDFAFENALISLDDVTYEETIAGAGFGIHEDATLFVKYDAEGTTYNCTTTISVVDKTPPVAIAKQNVIVQLTQNVFGNYTAKIFPENIDNGSYDACTGVTLAISQSEFTIADVGTVQVWLTVTDGYCNYNQTWTEVEVLGPNGSGVEPCQDTVELSTNNPWVCILEQISTSDFGISPTDEQGAISVDGENYFDVIGGLEYNAGDFFDVHIQYTDEGEFTECTSIVEVLDLGAPIAIGEPELVLTLVDDGSGDLTATITPEDIDDGSYDVCSDVTLSLSQSVFTFNDLGSNTVVLTVTDESGNYNQVWSNVIVILEGCDVNVADVVTWPTSVLEINNPAQSSNGLTPDVLMDEYGYAETDVLPTWPLEVCDLIGWTYEDLTINVGAGWKILRTFTVVNWNNGSVASNVQVIKNVQGNDVLVCVNGSTVLVSDSPVTLYAEDFLINYTGDIDSLTLVIEDDNGNVITDNIVTQDHIGQNFTYIVTDEITGNQCWGTLVVIGDNGPTDCGLESDDISWPLAMIQLTDTEVMSDELEPDDLVANYDFTVEEVEPTWPAECDNQVASSYSDVVFDLNGTTGNEFKIIRSWTVLDWIDLDIYEYVQTIKNTVDPATYICDVLPRVAPLGDCDSGHTDEDDVEWPNDIEVSDHRIAPSELVDFSGVDVLDSEPSFYNEPDMYSATYVDILLDLTSTQIILARNWTVTRNDGSELTWDYFQGLTVNFEDFDNLVTVGTPTGMALPDVMINGTVTTDENGKATVTDNGELILTKENDVKAGIDIRDVILLGDHLFGEIELDEFGSIAGDVDGDNSIEAEDVFSLVRTLRGVQTEFPISTWQFIDKTDETDLGLKPKGSFVGVKAGDIDDSFSGQKGRDIEDQYSLLYSDKLLNAGEDYQMSININDEAVMKGAELYFQYDNERLRITNVAKGDGTDLIWEVNGEGELFVMRMASLGDFETLEADETLLIVEFTSDVNGILSEEFALADNKRSFFIDVAYDYNIFSGEVQGVISGTFDDPNNALSFVNVYPNPASSVVNFDLPGVDFATLRIDILDGTGKVISSTVGQETIDVSNLNAGMYFYQITNESQSFIHKLYVVR